MMNLNSIETSQWLKQHQTIANHIVTNEGPKARYGRLICHWCENIQGKNPEDPVELKTHVYSACLDLKTLDVYLDCRKRKIFAKCCVHTIIRPIHTILFKTFYHLCLPVSIPYEIYKAVKEGGIQKQDRQTICWNVTKKVVRSLADIVRSPLYGIVMTISTLVGVILAPFDPQSLYTTRRLVGRMEQSLTWGVPNDPEWTIIRCFRPLRNLKELSQQTHRQYADTYYDNHPTFDGLSNFVRGEIKFLRKARRCDLFNDWGRKLDPKKTYISPSYWDLKKASLVN